MVFAELDDRALDQLFRQARTAHAFRPDPIPPETLRRLFELAQWGPTAFNAQPARFVAVASEQGKARLLPCLSPGNVAQTRAAPLTVIVAYDLQFYAHLPTLFPAYDAAPLYRDNPSLSEQTAQRNSTLQGAYLLLAARALGLDAGPMSGFDALRLDQTFFPQVTLKSNFLINLGVADRGHSVPRGARLSFEQTVQLV